MNNNVETVLDWTYSQSAYPSKGLWIFEEIEYEEAVKSNKFKAIAKQIKEAKAIAGRFYQVASRINQLSNEIDWDTDMIDLYANRKEISTLNDIVETLKLKLEVFEDKKVISAIDWLAKILWLQEETKKVSKKDVEKHLGL